jgi:hypothetical protein
MKKSKIVSADEMRSDAVIEKKTSDRPLNNDQLVKNYASEAQQAHLNLLAINHDLNLRVEMLENSASYRLGQAILRLRRPLDLFRRKTQIPVDQYTINVASLWPHITGEILLQYPSKESLAVQASSWGDVLLSTTIDLSAASFDPQIKVLKVVFDIPYDLGFKSFPIESLQVSIGNAKFAASDEATENSETAVLCHPLVAALTTIREVQGDLKQLRENLPSQRGVALLSVFRDEHRIRDHSEILIAELRRCGYSVIVIDTSTQPPISPIDCDLYIYRKNEGWDFASWVTTLAKYPWLSDESNSVLFINDSNVGPLCPLERILSEAKKTGLEIWGITDSFEIKHHLQSYFISFERSALESGVLQEFVNSYEFPKVKNSIIEAGEVRLTEFFSQRGLRLGALFPYKDLSKIYLETLSERVQSASHYWKNVHNVDESYLNNVTEIRFHLRTAERIHLAAPLNPTHYFWDILIRLGSPFVKRELLLRNPARIPGLVQLPALVQDEFGRSALRREIAVSGRASNSFSLPLAMQLEDSHPWLYKSEPF